MINNSEFLRHDVPHEHNSTSLETGGIVGLSVGLGYFAIGVVHGLAACCYDSDMICLIFTYMFFWPLYDLILITYCICCSSRTSTRGNHHLEVISIDPPLPVVGHLHREHHSPNLHIQQLQVVHLPSGFSTTGTVAARECDLSIYAEAPPLETPGSTEFAPYHESSSTTPGQSLKP